MPCPPAQSNVSENPLPPPTGMLDTETTFAPTAAQSTTSVPLVMTQRTVNVPLFGSPSGAPASGTPDVLPQAASARSSVADSE